MKAFRFKKNNSTEIKNYSVAVIFGIVISVFLFSGIDVVINPSILYLIAAIVSLIAIMLAIKKAGKEFEEILIEEEHVTFYFSNKMKDPISVEKQNLITRIDGDKIEFEHKLNGSIIGASNRRNIENSSKWNELLESFDLAV